MLVNQASGTPDGVYMGRGLVSCVNVLDIQEKIGALKTYLLFSQHVSTYNSVTVLFGNSKSTVLHKMKEIMGNNCRWKFTSALTAKKKTSWQLEIAS